MAAPVSDSARAAVWLVTPDPVAPADPKYLVRYYHGEFDPERLPFRSREEALAAAARIPAQPDVESARVSSEEQILRRKGKETESTLKGSRSAPQEPGRLGRGESSSRNLLAIPGVDMMDKLLAHCVPPNLLLVVLALCLRLEGKVETDATRLFACS